ncbi:hypothetical protein LIER_40033 [Lithospermum erythrorhizon]|uniref:Uncharacterized protein n=1 Tax=Lithospermum erythrorhizon TaxID=34254 RepID=A0AAV3QRR7_LITER
MVTRSKARVKAQGVAPLKESLPKEGVNVSIANGMLPETVGSVDKGKGLKGAGKVKTTVSQNPVVSPNSFDVLNGPGGGGWGLVAIMMRMSQNG